MKFSLISTLALFTSSANAASWDYKTNGADWPNLTGVDGNNCGGTNQSPIDLKTDGWPTYDAKDDNFQKMYTN
jgi:carbonic anhydrase